MFRNYIKTALRNLTKNKMFSLISIFGLSVGMVCFFLIFSFINYEKSYDNFHKNKDNIYCIYKEQTIEGRSRKSAKTGAPLQPLLLQEFPSIKNAVRFTNLLQYEVDVGGPYFTEKEFMFADPSVFDIFSFPLKTGNKNTALQEPFTVVLTPKTAQKLFSDQNPVGQTINVQTQFMKKKLPFTVTGILKETPANSHLKFNFLASYSSLNSILGNEFLTQKWEGPTWNYVMLQNGQTPRELEKLFPPFVEKFVDKGRYEEINYKLMPLQDMYYNTLKIGLAMGDFGISIISGFMMAIAFMILFIACINYTNLTTARASIRFKEIGIRKTLGAFRKQIIKQFLGESILFSLIAFIFALGIVQALLPMWGTFISKLFKLDPQLPDRIIDLHASQNIIYWIYLLIIAIVTGFLAGCYPAFYLSRFHAVDVMKGGNKKGKKSGMFRKILVITQFAASIVFIITSFHMIKQIDFLKTKDLGFDKEHVISIAVDDYNVIKKYSLLKNELIKHSSILNITSSSGLPGGSNTVYPTYRSKDFSDIQLGTYYVDTDFIKTLGIDIISGRDFSSDISSDLREAFIVNHEAMKTFGWENAEGQEMESYNKRRDQIQRLYKGKIIGVVKDFNFRSHADTKIQPFCLKVNTRNFNYLLIKIDNAHYTEAIQHLKTTWNEFKFDQRLEYSFVDDEIQKTFSIWMVLDKIIRITSLLALIIACLGILGLASFIIERKTKEIGIRKVLGASVQNITTSLSKSFLTLVFIANIIACPIAIFLTNTILSSMAYRINISVWLFILAALVSLFASLGIVGSRAIRAATANPVESLRYE